MPDLFSAGSLTRGLMPVLAWSIVVLAALCLGLVAAAILLRIRNNLVARRWARYEAAWEPAVLEIMAGAPPDELIRSVRAGDAPYFIGFLARIGRQVRGVELDRLAALAAPFLAHPIEEARAGNAEERARAVAALGLLGSPSQVPQVITALDDPAPLVAMSAARALTRRRDPTHAAALVARLDRLRHWRPGFLAAMLAALGPDAAPALRRALAEPRLLGRTRAIAAEALLRLSDPESAELAARTAAESDDPEVVAAALRLLERVGGPEQLPVVRRLAGADAELVRIGAFQALGALAEEEDLPLLAKGIEDPSVWVAEHAARGLARGSGQRLLAVMASSDAPRARLAREALAEATA